MNSKTVVETLPRIIKSAASLGKSTLGRRFMSTEASGSVEQAAKAVAGTSSQQVSKKSATSTQQTSSKGKRGSRRGNKNNKGVNPSPRKTPVAAAVATESQNESKKETSDVRRVATRLVDNHPLTEQDKDPRYYLSHLTKDMLDPNVPVFEEDRAEFPDLYSTTRKIETTDAYGHKVVEIQHVPSKREQELNSLGFQIRDDDMFGVNFMTPPIVGNGIPMARAGSGAQEDRFEEGSWEALNRDGELLEGSILKPGSDKQMVLDQELHARSGYALEARRQRRQLELGYDTREEGNSQPWVDTHRIEAIDARLRELHEQRDKGELNYPLEDDAVKEAQRIRAEEKEAIAAVRAAIGMKETGPLGDEYLYQQDDAQPSVQTSGRYITRRLVHKPSPAQSHSEDASLDTMDVYAIPVEKLYQARRQELDRIRSTHYEDYDLSYLLERSGKEMDRRDGARSLYEKRRGHTDVTRPATEEEKENVVLGARFLPQHLTAEEKAELGRKLVAYERYSGLSNEDASPYYAASVPFITPEMRRAEQARAQLQEDKDVSLDSSLFEKPSASGETVEQGTEEDVLRGAVSPALDAMRRDASKPLEDYEMGETENGDVMFAWRTNRQSTPNYLRDKEMFMDGVKSTLRGGSLSEEEMAKQKDIALTQEDIEQMRRNVGMPEDVSSKTYYKRYLRGMRRAKDDGEMVSEVMTGHSLSRPDEILRDLGLETEEAVEEYLMDTFKPHHAVDENMMPPEQKAVVRLLQKASKFAEDMKKEKKEGEGAAPAVEGAAPAEGEGAAPAETPVEGEGAAPAETPAETAPAPETPAEGESTEAAPTSRFAASEKAALEEEDDPYFGMSPLDAFKALQERLDTAREEANKQIPTQANRMYGSGHIVDALEYSDRSYVHEKDRELIFRMYQRGIHPKEISKTFGFHEDRIYAIIRLMKGREAKKEEGLFSDEIVKEWEAKESVFAYDYRDMPPAKYKNVDRRREAKVPKEIPRFVFLGEEEEEAKVMREIDHMVRRKRCEEEPALERKGLPEGTNGLANGLPKHTYKLAVMDISKGAKAKLLMSDHDGKLRQATEEEKIHRTWNRHQMRRNEYLVKMGLE